MNWTLLTGRSGTGNQLWREERLSAAINSDSGGRLVVSGCAENQVAFYPHFSRIILLSTPFDVKQARINARQDNQYGKRPEQ